MARNRLTLLEIVQRVLDAMNHDNVNSISDTIESSQIAEEARVVYYDLMDRSDWPHLIKTLPMESVVDVTRPNYLKIPTDVVRIDSLRYEITESGASHRTFREMQYLERADFLDLVHTRRTSESNVIVVPTFDDVDLFIINDQAPTYWTTFDDEYLVFDSYDSAVDTTMQGGKSLALVKQIPAWTNSDVFVPDMPDQMFSTYISEVTAAAFMYWKQSPSPIDERRSARGAARLRRSAEKINERRTKVDYGRKRPFGFGSMDGDKGSIRAAL